MVSLYRDLPSIRYAKQKSLTTPADVVMEYAYGRSDHRVDQEDFGPDYHDAVLEAGKTAGLLKQMIWIFHLMQSLPEWLAVLLSPSFDLVLRIQRVSQEQPHVHRKM